MLDLTAIKARRALIPAGRFIATLGSGEHLCTAIHAEQEDGTKVFVADFWPDYELEQTTVKQVGATMKAFMEYPSDIDALIVEVERLNAGITLAIDLGYDKGENYSTCKSCGYDGSMHRSNCSVGVIERLSSDEE